MDKNPDQVLADILKQIGGESSEHNPSIILASKPFHKAELVDSLLDSVNYPVIFLDFDLLYSGYVTSKIVKQRDDIHVFRPQKDDWNEILHSVLEKIYRERFMVIIDSFNGFHNMYDDKGSARFVNASLMLLAFIGKFLRCPVVVMALARKNKKNQWILSPGGRHVINPKNSSLYTVNKNEDVLSITPLKHSMQ